jgi:hypothetical protein
MGPLPQVLCNLALQTADSSTSGARVHSPDRIALSAPCPRVSFELTLDQELGLILESRLACDAAVIPSRSAIPSVERKLS